LEEHVNIQIHIQCLKWRNS